jgi:hypothetical protein
LKLNYILADVLRLSEVIQLLNGLSSSSESRKRARSSTSSVGSIAQASKVLSWAGGPARNRVLSSRRTSIASVFETVPEQRADEEAATAIEDNDVFFNEENPAGPQAMTPSDAANDAGDDVNMVAAESPAAADGPVSSRLPPRAARPRVFFAPSESSEGSNNGDRRRPGRPNRPGGPGRPGRPGPAGPGAPFPLPPMPPSASFNASNIRTHFSRHYGNQANDPSRGRRHPVSGGAEMFDDAQSLIRFSGFPSHPRNVAHTPVSHRLWISRDVRPSELCLKTTIISQSLIQNLRGIVADTPRGRTHLEGEQPDMELLRLSLTEFHERQYSTVDFPVEQLFAQTNFADPGETCFRILLLTFAF